MANLRDGETLKMLDADILIHAASSSHAVAFTLGAQTNIGALHARDALRAAGYIVTVRKWNTSFKAFKAFEAHPDIS